MTGLILQMLAFSSSLCASILLASRINAFSSPMFSHEKLLVNQMDWLTVPTTEKSLADFKAFKPEKQPELGLVSEDVVGEIAKTLYCASEDITQNEECKGFTSLVANHVILLKDDAKKTLYFGYSFFVNVPKLDADHIRNITYERSMTSWLAVSKVIAANPTFQQFHVGYRSGGTIAYLVAQRILSSTSLPFRKIEKNSFNYVKVVTVSEIPIFTKDINQDAVGNVNHAIFELESKIESSSEHYKLFGTRIALPSYHGTKVAEIPLERLALFSSVRTALVKLRAMPKMERKEFGGLVMNQLAMVQNVSLDLKNVFSEKTFGLYGQEQKSCASNLRERILEFLPHYKESEITCSVREPGNRLGFNKNDFDIHCAIKPSPHHSEMYQLASYRAKLTSYSERAESCKLLKESYFGRGSWSNCIKSLVAQSDELSLISPYGNDDSGNCRFFGIMDDEKWSTKPIGCVVKPNALDESLYSLYEHDPSTFFSLIPQHTPFTEECSAVIKPIFFHDTEHTSALSYFDSITKYFDSMSRETATRTQTPKRRKSLPELFQLHDPEGFRTISLTLSSNQFIADQKVSRNIIRSVSSKHIKFLDCTLPANHWVPDACPEFCISETSKNLDICATMTYFPAISAYIGYSTSIIPSSIVSGLAAASAYVPLPSSVFSQAAPSDLNATKEELLNSNLAQYALFCFKPNGLLNLSQISVGIFFTELPVVEKIEKGRQGGRLGRVRGRELNDDEIWEHR